MACPAAQDHNFRITKEDQKQQPHLWNKAVLAANKPAAGSAGLDKVSGTSQAEESSWVKSRKRDSQAYNTVSFPTLAPHKSCVLSLSSLTLINNLKHNLFPPQELIPTATHHPHTWYQPPLHCTINSSPNSCGISSSRTIHAAFWKKVKQGWSRSCGRAVNHHHFIRLE